MKTLLIIFNVAAEDDVCRLFLPFWQRSGCNILFSSPYDARSQLDGVLHFYAGKAMIRDRSPRDQRSWWWYQSRVLATMKAVVKLPYDGFVFTQYDSICLNAFPLTCMDLCHAHVASNNSPAFRAKTFVHPPWCFSTTGLQAFITEALKHEIDSEHGIMDRWMAWVLECAGIPVTPTNEWSWSANSIDTPELVQSCRNAITQGAKFVHGVKNQQQLDAILR